MVLLIAPMLWTISPLNSSTDPEKMLVIAPSELKAV